MASAGSAARPKMAAGGPARRASGAAGARARGRPGTPGEAFPGWRQRRRPPGRGAEGSLEGRHPANRRPPSPCSSRKAADRRCSKRLKNSPVKSELGGLASASENLAALGEAPNTPDGDRHSEDPGGCGVIQQKKGESIPEANEDKQEKEHNASLEPCAVKPSGAPSEMDSDENPCSPVCSKEESSCASALSDGSGVEDGDVPTKPTQADNSAFLDEDSNQPMPVERFFGDAAFGQDLPAPALPSTTMSRREFRKLHFIAKEDDEEEEDVV